MQLISLISKSKFCRYIYNLFPGNSGQLLGHFWLVFHNFVKIKFIFRVIFTILDIFEIRDFGIVPNLRGFSSEDLDEMLNQAGESATNLEGKKGKWSRKGFSGLSGTGMV